MELGDGLNLTRMFFGDFPPLFYLEIVIRTGVMYLWALLMVRFMGTRGLQQLSPFDFVIIIALGSSVGDPMFYAQVPLLHGMLVITVIVALQKGLARSVQREEDVERFVEGTPQRLASDGRLDLDGLKMAALGREELFAELRRHSVEHMGQIKRAYMEQSGQISVFLYQSHDMRPGLPLIPPWDIGAFPEYQVDTLVADDGAYACYNCGEVRAYHHGDAFIPCPNCDHETWTVATQDPIRESVNVEKG